MSAYPRLPIELFAEITNYLPKNDILQLALTNKDLYDLTIGQCYRRVDIASVHDDILDIDKQESSLECIKVLLGDVKKRNGVESIRFCGIGEDVEYTDEVRQFEAFRIKREKWLSNQQMLNQAVTHLLSDTFDFPRLQTMIYDANALVSEDDVVCFMSFLRRNPGIRNVIIDGDNTKPFDRWTFSRLPNDLACRFALLKRAMVYGPLLPLLLGFSFSPNKRSGQFGPLIRMDNMPDTLPLKHVHIWWPQRTVHIVRADDPVALSIKLDVLDVIKALASLCGSSLEVLVVKVDDELIDEDLVDLICARFANLRELEIGTSRTDPLARVSTNPTVLGRVAEALSGLDHLTRFGYRVMSHDCEGRSRYAAVLEGGKLWNDMGSVFARHCPSLQSITLFSLTWKVVSPEDMTG